MRFPRADVTRPVLFVHSAGPQGPHQGSADFVESLQSELGADYAVHFPKFPDPENPRYDAWKQRLERELASTPAGALLVGHSLGGSVLLKYLAENRMQQAEQAIFVRSAPYWDGQDWDVSDFQLPADAAASLARFPRVFLYHNRDNSDVPFAHLARYAALLPQAVVRELDGFGHEFPNGCPQLVADIRKVGRTVLVEGEGEGED